MNIHSLGTSEVKITPIIMGTWQAGKDMWVGIDDCSPRPSRPYRLRLRRV